MGNILENMTNRTWIRICGFLIGSPFILLGLLKQFNIVLPFYFGAGSFATPVFNLIFGGTLFIALMWMVSYTEEE